MITEVITWTLLKDAWPEPGDDTMSLVVSTDDEDGPVFEVIDGCTCFEDMDDRDPYYPRSYKWFALQNGDSVEGLVHAWTTGPMGTPVINALMPPTHWSKQPASLIPEESELS